MSIVMISSIFALLVTKMADSGLPRIGLATLVSVADVRYPPYSTMNSVPLAMRYLRQRFGLIFNFTHNFLPAEPVIEIELETNVEDIIGRFYFQNRQDTMALLSPCKLNEFT